MKGKIKNEVEIRNKLNLPDYYEILGEEEIDGEKTYICGQSDEDGYCMFTVRDFRRLNFYPKINLVYFEDKEGNVKIADIITGDYKNRGCGSLLMKYLINYLEGRQDIKKVNGVLVNDDSDHFDRIEHFYKKFGFEVKFKLNENGEKISGSIEKIINSFNK